MRILSTFLIFASALPCHAEFRAGAAITDVTPVDLPVLVNGGMISRSKDVVKSPLKARSICLHDGETELAIVVVDSCMMPRPLLDESKKMAHEATGISPDHILISATHTHTAGACMGCLGTDADSKYTPFLRDKLAESIAAAQKNLEPAQVGAGVENAAKFTALRRWIRRPDRLAEDPFGNFTVRANMHSARNWDDVIGESGPEDPDLSVMSIRRKDGTPLAVLANFSMHYFGDRDISSDYFGVFAEGLQEKLGGNCVAMMSHGCSGDIWRRDYRLPAGERGEDTKMEDYAADLVEIAHTALSKIEHKSDVTLAMAEKRLHLNYRVPNQQLLEWSQRIMDEVGDRLVKTKTEVYAREQILLHEAQSTDVVVQALRIGDFAMATTPNETYALTGLKIKALSPLQPCIVFDLTNGGDGYIPPPEQHLLGGYNTWPARSAALEVEAEPKIAEAAVHLLERVSQKPRRAFVQSRGPATERISKLKPDAWFRLDEWEGPLAKDSSGNQRDGIFEPRVAYFLEGPKSAEFCKAGETNRAAHFAGERLMTRVKNLGNDYSVSFWFWNGMPNDGRDVTGWLFSRDFDHGRSDFGNHLGITGLAYGANQGKLLFQNSTGKTVIERWTWNHAALIREAGKVRVFLNGQLEIETEHLPLPVIRLGFKPEGYTPIPDLPKSMDRLFFGGSSDSSANFEGRMDEITIFARALTADEVAQLAR